MNIEEYGVSPSLIPEDAIGVPGRIVAQRRGLFELVCNAGFCFARLKAGAYQPGGEVFPTTGDFVLLDWRERSESLILRTLPRKTCFTRLAPSSSGHRGQAVAANFDYVFIMQPLDRGFNPRGAERCLALAWQSGARPLILLTKADCSQDPAASLRAAEKSAAGADVFAVSVRTGLGMDQLSEYLSPGKTIVLIGPSGAGKSSLVNALEGADVMATGLVREKDSRGRHTTSHRQLILLRSGVMVIDTPGIREIGMWDASEGLERSFADVERHLTRCKFRNCRHQSEPGCAVKDAIRRGELSMVRWESYLRLEAEARFSGDRAEYMREKERQHKQIAKSRRHKRDGDYRFAPCSEGFTCAVCGIASPPEYAGSAHRNHCPRCLSSAHLDDAPGDRASLCGGIMDPIGVWVRKNGEWAIIHRCRSCGTLRSNRIAADDNPTLLMSIAVKPLASPPFPLWGEVDAT